MSLAKMLLFSFRAACPEERSDEWAALLYVPFNINNYIDKNSDSGNFMPAANNFRNYYRKISNEELLNILSNPHEYQPAAVEAAKHEFSDRQLSEKDIKEARQLLIDKQLQKQKQKEKIKAVGDKIIASGNTLIDTLNPIQQGIPTTEKRIRWIVIVMGVLFLFNFIGNFKSHLFYAKGISRFPIESTVYLGILSLLPIAIFTFWKKFKIGWIFLIIFLVFSMVGVLIQTLMWSPDHSPLDTFFPRPSISTLLIQLAFFGGLVYLLCKQNIRNEFSVSEKTMITTLLGSGVFYFFVIFPNS